MSFSNEPLSIDMTNNNSPKSFKNEESFSLKNDQTCDLEFDESCSVNKNDSLETNEKTKNNFHNRILIELNNFESLTKEQLIDKWKQQDEYINNLEQKLKSESDKKKLYQENEEKLKQHLFDLTRKENLLIMKLTTKDHEMQEYIKQIQELKLSQVATNDQLQNTFLDPAINMIFEEMKKEVDRCKLKVEEMQNELSAWKFTPDSNTGKRLMAKCRLLYQENEELGKVISSGRIAKLEGELALLKSFSEEMKKGEEELGEYLREINEDSDGMQCTIYHLQQQLIESREQLQKYQEKEKIEAEPLNELNNDNSIIKKKFENFNGDTSISSQNLNENSKKSSDEIINENIKDNSIENDKEDAKDNLNENKILNKSSNQFLEKEEKEITLVEKNLNENATIEINIKKNSTDLEINEETKQTSDFELVNKKRTIDKIIEEENLSECGMDSIIRKHRKLEQEKIESCFNDN